MKLRLWPQDKEWIAYIVGMLYRGESVRVAFEELDGVKARPHFFNSDDLPMLDREKFGR